MAKTPRAVLIAVLALVLSPEVIGFHIALPGRKQGTWTSGRSSSAPVYMGASGTDSAGAIEVVQPDNGEASVGGGSVMFTAVDSEQSQYSRLTEMVESMSKEAARSDAGKTTATTTATIPPSSIFEPPMPSVSDMQKESSVQQAEAVAVQVAPGGGKGQEKPYDSAVATGSLGLQVVEGLAVVAAIPAIFQAVNKQREKAQREVTLRERAEEQAAKRAAEAKEREEAKAKAEVERKEKQAKIEARIKAAKEEEERQERVRQMVLDAQLKKSEEEALAKKEAEELVAKEKAESEARAKASAEAREKQLAAKAAAEGRLTPDAPCSFCAMHWHLGKAG
ncbi:unnamed protein product [Discosporangium mesarthrocarpum]